MEQGKIYIPEALRTAQTNNELIVFAGAGVSFARPTYCDPLINVLEAAWNRYAPDDFVRFEQLPKPIDIPNQFDELVKQRGNIVKQFVQRAYAKLEEPSLLHKGIVRLFGIGQEMKIVTTNYDKLMSKAAEQYRGAQPNEYVYPHLSLDTSNRHKSADPRYGDATDDPNPRVNLELDGIAYIHGAVGCDPGDMILTRRDFNEAYVGRHNRAFPFLSSVLDGGYVLFLGYSSNDPIIPRIISTRCDTNRAFVFAHDDDSGSWSDIGADVRTYLSPEWGDKHELLIDTLRGWTIDIYGDADADAWYKKPMLVSSQLSHGKTSAELGEGRF